MSAVTFFPYADKPVTKGQPRERQHMVFMDKWCLFGSYFVLFCQGRVIEMWPLFRGGLNYRYDCTCISVNTGWVPGLMKCIGYMFSDFFKVIGTCISI